MKKLYILLLVAFTSTATMAQTGAKTTQELGKALFTSLQTDKVDDMYPFLVGEAELKTLKKVNDPDEELMVKFLAQNMKQKMGDEWKATRDELTKDGVDWKDAGSIAVSHEPMQGKNGTEVAILQVLFKSKGTQYAISVQVVQVNGLWFIAEKLLPKGYGAYEK